MSLIEKIAASFTTEWLTDDEKRTLAQAALTAIMGEGDGVQQCDREAAASGYFAWCSGNPVIPDKMKAGQADVHSMVQAFARHRSTSAAAERARSAAKLRAAADRFDKKGWETEWAIADELRELADAIERGEV